MNNATTTFDKGFRFAPEMISHAIWLYYRFSLSYRDVEEVLAKRGVGVKYGNGTSVNLRFG